LSIVLAFEKENIMTTKHMTSLKEQVVDETLGSTPPMKENMSKATIGILENTEIVHLATGEYLGEVIDIGDEFVFKSKPDGQLSEEENEQVALLVESFNDRSIGDFWQKGDSEIEASLAHLDNETRSTQSALKGLLGSDYVTEEEVRRSVGPFFEEFGAAVVQLWKEGKIIPGPRNEYGEILSKKAPANAGCN
jgi:hypothetical protein